MKPRLMFLAAGVLFVVLAATAQEKKTDEMKTEKKPAPTMKVGPATSSMQGYLVDAMCAKGMSKKTNVMEKAAGHSRTCALEEDCAASGYGIFSNAVWYKFDEKGDKEAKAFLEKTKLQKGIMVAVSGEVDGSTLKVVSLKEYAAPKETGKAETKPVEKK